MKVKVLENKRLLDDFFKVDAAVLQHERFDGDMTPAVRRLNLDRGEASAVLIYVEDQDKFVLIRQFRYAHYAVGESGWIEEIVAGVLEGDTPEECARRESIEEAGYEINQLEKINTIYASPGIMNERIHLFLGFCNSGDKKYPGGGNIEEQEDIQIIELLREDALEKLNAGYFTDGKTMLSLLYFFMKYGK